jgi:hypothetical protein
MLVPRMKKSNNVNKKDSAAKRIPRVSSNKGQKTKMKRKNNKLDKKGKEKQIIVTRSSGRHEKFDTNRMTQTVSRSGVPFLMARDVAENISNKIRKEVPARQDSRIKKKDNKRRISANVKGIVGDVSKQQAQAGTKNKTVSAGQIRSLVAAELRDRNRSDIAASYSGQTPENTLGDQFQKQNQNDRISVTGATQHTRQPANRNRVIHDMSKRGGGIST